MSPPTRSRSRSHRSPPRRRTGRSYWSFQQVAWWILERDRDAVSSISGSGTFAGLELRYCAEVFANRRASGEGLDFSSLPNLQQQQIDRAEALMRPRYSALKMQGGETLIPDYSAMERTYRWTVAGPWFGRKVASSPSGRQLSDSSRVQRRNYSPAYTLDLSPLSADQTAWLTRPIETYYWPYYGLYAWNGEICAAPHNLGDGALASRLKQNSPSTEPTIWLDLRVEAQEICDLWPVEAPTSGTASHPNLEAEHRMRDAHATIRRLIKRKWPSASSRPSMAKMARELAHEPSVQAAGFRDEALRKILGGTYMPFRRLGLDPLLAGTRTKRRIGIRTSTRKKREPSGA
jgi:hypothetical protein